MILAAWTDDRVERLIELWADGITAANIARELGGTTRNAVIGKVQRLGLKRRCNSAVSEKPKRKPPRAARGNYSTEGSTNYGILFKIKRKLKKQEPKLKSEPFKPRIADAVSRRVSILDLKAMECRYPDESGNPEKGIPHTFCGNPTEDGSSYCPAHAALVRSPGTKSERNAGNLIARAA